MNQSWPKLANGPTILYKRPVAQGTLLGSEMLVKNACVRLSCVKAGLLMLLPRMLPSVVQSSSLGASSMRERLTEANAELE